MRNAGVHSGGGAKDFERGKEKKEGKGKKMKEKGEKRGTKIVKSLPYLYISIFFFWGGGQKKRTRPCG